MGRPRPARGSTPATSRPLCRRAEGRRRGRLAPLSKRASSSWARPVATASGATTSPLTSGPSEGFRMSLAGDGFPEILEVRGEVYMTDAGHRPAQRGARGRRRGSPRSPTPGTPRPGRSSCSTPRLCSSEGSGSSPTAWARPEGDQTARSYTEVLGCSKGLGHPRSARDERPVLDAIDEVIAHAETWQTRRNDLDYQTDGLVIKVDDLGQRVAVSGSGARARGG